MKISVVKGLVAKHTRPVLEDASARFEATRDNVLDVTGDSDGEILSHLLVAVFIKEQQATGLSEQEAIREYSRRARAMIG